MKRVVLWSLGVLFGCGLVMQILEEGSALQTLADWIGTAAMVVLLLALLAWPVVYVVGVVRRDRAKKEERAAAVARYGPPTQSYTLKFNRSTEEDVVRIALDLFTNGGSKKVPWEDLHPPGTAWTSGPLRCKVAGVSYREREIQTRGFSIGKPVKIVHEPDNPHSTDGKTLAVFDEAGVNQAGYIPSEDSGKVFDRMESGEPISAFVQTVFELGGKRVGLRLLLTGPDVELFFSKFRM